METDMRANGLVNKDIRRSFAVRLSLLTAMALSAMCGAVAVEQSMATSPVCASAERLGPPTMYSPSVERYRFGATDVTNQAFYPIPQEPVTRETYLRWLEDMDLFTLVLISFLRIAT